jgi:hypothetical protein
MRTLWQAAASPLILAYLGDADWISAARRAGTAYGRPTTPASLPAIASAEADQLVGLEAELPARMSMAERHRQFGVAGMIGAVHRLH